MKSPDFDTIYRGVPREQVDRLLLYRAAHSHQHLHAADANWSDVASGQGGDTILLPPGGERIGDVGLAATLRRAVLLCFRPGAVSPGWQRQPALAEVAGHKAGAGLDHVEQLRQLDVRGTGSRVIRPVNRAVPAVESVALSLFQAASLWLPVSRYLQQAHIFPPDAPFRTPART